MSTKEKKFSNKELKGIRKAVAEGIAEAFQEFYATPEWKKFLKSVERYKESQRLFAAWQQAVHDNDSSRAMELRKQFSDHVAKCKKEAE